MLTVDEQMVAGRYKMKSSEDQFSSISATMAGSSERVRESCHVG